MKTSFFITLAVVSVALVLYPVAVSVFSTFKAVLAVLGG